MFETGTSYEVEFIEPGGDRSFVRGSVIAHEGTLLKLATEKGERIFNTAALSFVGAQPWKMPTDPKYQPMKPPTRNA